MAENNSIDNLSRQDLLTVLDGFIKQTEQINEIKDEYNSRYNNIASEVLLKEYKKPKNLIIAYFLAPFYLLKGKKLRQETFFWWSYRMVGLMFGLAGYLMLIRAIQDLVAGSTDFVGVALRGFICCEAIGFFMGRKKYKQHWLKKEIKKGNYDNEIDAAVDSDPQIIDYKNKRTSLVNDATYQQYLSLIPQNFTFSDIVGIYQMLLDYRADNFKEAVNAWRQEQHNKQVENKMNENDRSISQMGANITNLAMRAKQQDEAKAKAEAEAAAKAHADRFERDRRKIAEKERDQAIKDIAGELKSLNHNLKR